MHQREWFWPFLYPVSVLWAVVTRLRRFTLSDRTKFRSSLKTILVGNLHSGGSGKTPILLALAEALVADRQVVVLSRGYKGRLSRQGARVDLGADAGPSAYGDEPWMLAQRLKVPVYIGQDRVASLKRAQSETSATLALVDDAFQNFSFEQDIRLIALRADRPVDEAFCLPLGDLREPLSALASAHAVLLIPGKDASSEQRWRTWIERLAPGLPVFEARAKVIGVWGAEGAVEVGASLTWGAFSGIGFPAAFHDSLQEFLKPLFAEVFPDHHTYTEDDVARLVELKARKAVNLLITTEKDWHKVNPLFQARDQAVFYLRIGYEFSEEFWYFLKSRLESA